MHNLITTKDNLYHRGENVGSRVCIMCEISKGTMGHIFFKHRVTREVWVRMCNKWV